MSDAFQKGEARSAQTGLLRTQAPQSQPVPTTGVDYAGSSDNELVSAYTSGDQLAFEQLYSRYRGSLYRYFLRQLPPASANDGFQETWYKFVNSLDRYNNQDKLQAYLFKIAHNVLMDYHRKSMREQGELVVEELVDDGADPVTQVSAAQLKQLLLQQLQKLPVAQRSVWLLKNETQLSLQDIAELTETTLEAVKSRLRYATDKLKVGMQRYVRS